MEQMILQDICKVYDCPHTTAKDEGIGIPLVRTPNIGKGRLLLTNAHRVNSDIYQERTRRAIPEEDDIIIAREAPVGNAAIIQMGQKVCLGQRVVLLKPIRDRVDPNYLVYYLLSDEIQHRLRIHANGAVVAHLNMADIRNLPVSLPSLSEQKKIGRVLKIIDDKIELNRRINDNLEQQAQALFAEVFESDHTFTQLGAVIETCSGGTPSRNNLDYYIDGTICWVKSKELNRSFLFDTEEKIAQVGIDRSSAKLLPKNSVLIAMYGATVGEYCIIDKPMTCNQAICALLPSSDYPASYLYMFIKQKRNELINLAVGSAQQNISQVLIKGLSVSANLKLIAKFDKMVMPIFNMIRKNVKESIILEAERNTLLPRLMSGELKINDLNC